MASRSFLLYAAILLTSASLCHAQHTWQKPKPPMPRADVDKLIGPVTTNEPSRELNVVWVWGYDKPHAPGAHDYVRIRDTFTALLRKVPRVTVDTAYGFPTAQQFAKADLLVMFLHLPRLTDEQYAMFRGYIERGGGVVALHETAIMRPASDGKKLAHCLGMSWNDGRSKWGAIFEDIAIDNTHPVFARFPDTLKITDEFYWQLNRTKEIKVIGDVRTGPPEVSRGPLPVSRLSKLRSPMFWTLESGKGRVFGTTTGHNTFTYFDPEFRIVLFRAMAWATGQKPDPFMPLVFDGITSEAGLVGTTDDMRDYPNKPRGPKPK